MVPLFLLLASVCCLSVAQQHVTITNYTTPTGTISSPNFGTLYPANSSYRYLITEDIGKYITLTINSFAVEGYSNVACKYDWVVVVEGDNVDDLKDCTFPPTGALAQGVYCNYHAPPNTLALSSNRAAIQFCSDVVIEDLGFQISWITVDTPPIITTESPPKSTTPTQFVCGNPITLNVDQTTDITSPNYPPGPYPNNADCTWVVTSNAAVMKVRTTFFDVEGYSNQCYYDKLTVTDQYGTSTVYCMSRGPNIDYPGTPPFDVTFSFVSDDQIQFPGFDISLTGANTNNTPPVDSQCGTTFTLSSTTDSAMLYSPGWPYDYRNNENCSWQIVNTMANQNYSIQFLFMDFSTEVNADRLVVVQDDGQTKKYDGFMPKNSTAIFPTPSLSAKFITDANIVSSGFDILVTLVPTPFFCPPKTFQCRHVQQCIPMELFCNGGPPDCPDGSDESSVICRLNTTCGISHIQPNINVPHGNIFIVNGTQAKPFSWPWVVGIYRRNIDYFMCGGTLIEPRWVLTSARCLAGDSGDPYGLLVKAASYEQHSTSAHEQDTNVTSIILHPQYNPTTFENDIALLLLDTTIVLNNWTNVACLPYTEYIVPPNSKCIVAGWGTTQNTGNNTVLRQMLASVIADSVCNDTDHYNGAIPESQMCAGDDRGYTGICQGDFGSALACPDSSDRFFAQGIASQNAGSSCAAPNKPGRYSRTSFFMDFVLQTMEEYNKL